MPHPEPNDDPLERALAHAAHLLPGQRPLEAFVHHNTLHPFEHLPFDEAVLAAARRLGGEPYLSEARYREAWEAARVRATDLDEALAAVPATPLDLGPADLTEREVVRRMMRHLEPPRPAAEVAWALHEGDLLTALPHDLPRDAAERLRAAGPLDRVLGALWAACEARQEDAWSTADPPTGRDRMCRGRAAEVDARVNPVLIRWLGAYLDGGMAYWPMPGRARGLYAAVLDQLALPAPSGPPWTAPVARWARRLREAGTSPLQAAREALARLDVPPSDLDDAVLHALRALPGWAGMFVQLAARPDLAPTAPPPTDLVDLLAVRLLFDEAALRDVLGARSGPLPPPVAASAAADAPPVWTLFQLCRMLGLTADDLARPGRAAALAAVHRRWDELARRRLWHHAYERRYRVEVLDALVAHRARTRDVPRPAPWLQVLTCIDDREESFRRHLEELDAGCETFGYAGFFAVPMAYRGLDEARSRPLCPAGIVPEHLVVEEVHPEDRERWERGRRTGARLGRVVHAGSVGSRTLARGILLSLGGVGAALPLASRLLAPGTHARLTRRRAEVRTVLHVARRSEERVDGFLQGFTVDEMVAAAAEVLTTTGLAARLAPLVVILGHGASSQNNPHQAAYDCGACGGGRGGPNARALAAMLSRADVREALRARHAIDVPDSTCFVGGYHDTTDDDVVLYDLEDRPATHHDAIDRAAARFEAARRRNAHERCRRFEPACAGLSEEAALRHVEDRSEDLAQPRPERGHVTNALCLIGRRAWSRGLFLDRRAFLVSYEPAADPAGGGLGRLLAAVAPVGAGINLEYYFSTVDPQRYGCGSKLPHNVTGLLGVMDGPSSDLRTGLPWQMVEIHEPVRLLCVIEGTPAQVAGALRDQPGVRALVERRWVLVAAFDPELGKAWFLGPEGFTPHVPERTALPEVDASVRWYAGRTGFLPPALTWDAFPGPTPGARAVEAR